MSPRSVLYLALLLALPAAASAASTSTAGLPLYAASTAPVTVNLVLERFERFDRDMLSLSGSFRQFVHAQDTDQTQSVEGTFAYKKSDRLRIEHLLPEPQTVVCDGSWVWVWRPANLQVIRSKLADWKKSQPLAQGLLDFGKYSELLRRYDVSVATVSAPGPDGHRDVALALKPRGDEHFTLTLRLSTRDFFPFDSELRIGLLSAHTVFSGVRFNRELPDSLFKFAPPPGSDVLDFPARER